MMIPHKMRIPLGALVGILLLWWISTMFFIVDESEFAITTRFGKTISVYNTPGLRLKYPAPIDRVLRFEKRTLYQSVSQGEYLTADKKNIMVSSFLTWKIENPERFMAALYTREAAEKRLETLVNSEIGAAFGERPFTDFVPDHQAMLKEVAASEAISEVEKTMYGSISEIAERDYGIQIELLGISKFNFPDQNLSSVYARMRAERERIAESYRSEGEAEARKIVSEAERKSAEITAAAEAKAEALRGNSEAAAAKTYAEAFGKHGDFYDFLRTLDVYEKIIKEDTTIILPDDAPILQMLMKPEVGKEKN